MENLKSKNVRVIYNENGEKFMKVMTTEEFIYFVKSDVDGDYPMMFRKDDLSLASNNSFADQNLIEDIENGKATWIAPSFQENVDLILEAKHDDDCQCMGCV